LALLKYII